MKTPIFIALALTAVCVPSAVLAIGISASPATLSIKTEMGQEGTAHFTITNPSTEVGVFEAYPEEFETDITLVPSRFVLEAGEKREVLVRARGKEVGKLRTAIAVEAQPLGTPSQGVGGGVRLPFSLETVAGSSLLSAVFFSGAWRLLPWFLLGALTVFFLVRRVSLSTLKARFRKSTL